LKTVAIGANVAQLDSYAFHNCTSLKSVYKLGQDPVDGVADMTMFDRCAAGILKNTAIETVKLKSSIKAESLNSIAFIGCKNIVATVDEAMKEYVKSNYLNLINIDDANDVYEHYMYINPETVVAGNSSVASFDEKTGTLTILGSGEITDIINYYGGGSKKQPWFSYKQDIKKIIIGPQITYIGKYTFCQCKNLEELELSSTEIEIGAGAFEKCYNLKSVYVSGSEALIGTFDLRTVPVINAWVFAYNYYAVNLILSNKVEKISDSTFEDCMNLSKVYCVPGTYAETYANEKGFAFADVDAELPVAKLATPPAINQDEKEKAERSEVGTETTELIVETKPLKYHFVIDDPDALTSDVIPNENEKDGNVATIFIIIGAFVSLAIITVVTVIIVRNNKKTKR
ncbi:MAG: leucine-rich repeat protein, partial [Clostridia bacterium]|nr:leucine-rich repeat protein [Clostridia bacterium]